ncbi:MAG TPA: hypothetical protein VIF83_14580, partial [Gemmatimonadaceae bacterium]
MAGSVAAPSLPRSAASAVVHKFGGAALADAKAIRHAAEIVAARPSGAVVVASAMKGVTDALLDIAVVASRGEHRAALAAIEAVRERHVMTEAELAAQLEGFSTADTFDRCFDDLSQLVESIDTGGLP